MAKGQSRRSRVGQRSRFSGCAVEHRSIALLHKSAMLCVPQRSTVVALEVCARMFCSVSMLPPRAFHCPAKLCRNRLRGDAVRVGVGVLRAGELFDLTYGGLEPASDERPWAVKHRTGPFLVDLSTKRRSWARSSIRARRAPCHPLA